MIRLLKDDDIEMVCNIVNNNWKKVYDGYVNAQLLSEEGCLERANRMKEDFLSGRLSHYVYEDNGQIVALLSIGKTGDEDKLDDFELWWLYILDTYQHKGIGGKLLAFAEEKAKCLGYKEIVIWAFKENLNAISFYKKHGYKQDKEHYLDTPYFAYGVRFCKYL